MTTQLVNPEVVSAAVYVTLVLPEERTQRKNIYENSTAFELKMEHIAQEKLNDYRVELHFADSIQIIEDDEEFGRDNLNACNEVRIVSKQSAVEQVEGIANVLLKSKPQE